MMDEKSKVKLETCNRLCRFASRRNLNEPKATSDDMQE